jgi:hypothetical protein
MVQEPSQLATGKIRIDHQARLIPNQFLVPRALQFIAKSGRAPILPHDSIMNGLPGAPVPEDGCLPLVRNADA